MPSDIIATQFTYSTQSYMGENTPDLFHLTSWLQAPSILLQNQDFINFYGGAVFQHQYTPHFLYLIISWWTSS